MGNFIQKGHINLNDYETKATIDEGEHSKFTIHTNKSNEDDFLLLKDISLLTEMMQTDCQAEILDRILNQSYFFSLLRLDQWQENNQRTTVMHTRITPKTLEQETLNLRAKNAIAEPQVAWAILGNLLMAVMDMEHKVEFHRAITMKSIYFNANSTINIINPYFRDSHVRQALKDIIKPILESPSWKPEYSSDYFARVEDLDDNDSMRMIHNDHQHKVRHMLKSVVYVVLGLLTHFIDDDFFDDSNDSNRVNYTKVNAAIEVLDKLEYDSDIVDLIEHVLKYEPKSSIVLVESMTERQYHKMYRGLRSKEIVCPDPVRVEEMLRGLDINNAYDPTATRFIDDGKYEGGRGIDGVIGLIGGQIRDNERREQELQDVSRLIGNQIGDNERREENKKKIVKGAVDKLKNTQNKGIQLHSPSDAASDIKLLKEFRIDNDKPSNELRSLPKEIVKLKEFDVTNDKLPGFTNSSKDRLPSEIDILKKFMDTGDKWKIEREREVTPELTSYNQKTLPLSTQYTSNPVVNHDHYHHHHHKQTCRMHSNLGDCSLSCHLHKPLYSPYAHLYYAGRPLTTTEKDILHENPVSSR